MIMRGEKLSNNLYKLMGDTISGEAAMSTSEILEDDSTHLMAPSSWPYKRASYRGAAQAKTIKELKVFQVRFLQAQCA